MTTAVFAMKNIRQNRPLPELMLLEGEIHVARSGKQMETFSLTVFVTVGVGRW